MKKNLYHLLNLLLATTLTTGIGLAQYEPTSAPALKTFALDGDMTGAASNSVNLFTGDVALPLSLLSLPGRNGLDVNVAISYTSQVQQQVDKWNLEAPTGILGLGWNMDLPRIVCDHKQTGTRIDDEYYLVEGGSSNRLIRTTGGQDQQGHYYVYEPQNWQPWRVRYYYDGLEMGLGPQGPNMWEIVRDDGTIYKYGDRFSGRKTVQWLVRWGNWIGNSSQTQGQSQMAHIWNLSEVVNTWGERILFEYEQEEQFVGTTAGQKHTEASYIKKITDVNGRQVIFIYKPKQQPYYIEAHTERPEPDAYQEIYEKKFLDAIEVRNSTNEKLLSVHFSYIPINGGTNKAKMLLSRIEQRNASGTALPALKYQYHLNGSYKGMLQTITYLGGGNITYHYATKTITKSERELAITAPSGYAEPKVWVANDYTVVAWRQLASGGVHTDAARNVKLFAYQWVGEWKGQELATISNIHVQEDSWSKDYKDFQVSVHDNHFAVLTRVNNTSSNYDLRIFEKSKEIRSTFIGSSFQINLGTSKPTLMGSNSYISVGPGFRTSGITGIYTYVPNGNSWLQSTLNLNHNAPFNYFGSENFIYTQFRLTLPTLNPGINNIRFRVLSEDKKWTEKVFPINTEWEPLPNLVVGTNNFVITRENNTPKYIYNWDINFNNLARVTTDKNNTELFGNLNDTITYSSIISNSLVGFNGRLSRFDGKYWYSRRLNVLPDYIIYGNGPSQIRNIDLSYGHDFVVRAIEKQGWDYLTGFIEFNPNELQWGNDIIQIGTGQTSTVNAGVTHYYVPGKYYFRQPNGNWLAVNPPAGLIGSPRALTMTTNSEVRFENGRGGAQGQGNLVRVLRFENNTILTPYSASGSRYLMGSSDRFPSNGVGNNIFISRNYNGSPIEDATTIYLTKYINNNITGKQTDNVVSHISINDGLTTRHIAYDYDLGKAVMDPTGATAQYHEVLEIPGSATAASKPYGYTKHFFGNGLTQQELGHSYNSSNLLWAGALYKKEVYNASNNLLASEYTRFENFGKDLLNDVAAKVGHALYTRPVEQIAIQDGIEQKTNFYYLSQTGQLDYSIALDFDGKGNNLRTNHKYFWQAYDPNRTLQIISPVVQTTQILQTGATPITLSVEATTWKPWIGGTNYAPHKSYVWLKTGNADFNFTNWSGTGEPGGDWRKTQEINTIDALGIVQQSTSH